jgi:hypothetical protein
VRDADGVRRFDVVDILHGQHRVARWEQGERLEPAS